MCRRLLFFLFLIFAVAFGVSASAESYTWTDGAADNNSWCEGENWSSATIPGSGDTAVIDVTSPERGPIIGGSCNVNVSSITGPISVYGQTHIMDINTSGTFNAGSWRWEECEGTGIININGTPTISIGGEQWRGPDKGVGILNISGDPNIILNNTLKGADGDEGFFSINMSGGRLECDSLVFGDNGGGEVNLSDGTIILGDSLDLGGSRGVAPITVNVSGGLMRIGGDLQLPGNANRAGVVVVNLDAGVIECGEFVHGSVLDEGPSYTDEWLLDIEQGMLIIDGNVIAAIDANVAAGQITAYGGDGYVIVELIDGNTVVTGVPDTNSASNPDPAHKSRNVPLDQVLSWTPGDHATKHDLFIGTSFDDVNDANTSDSTYQDRLDTNSWDPCSNGFDLEKAVTYYWRIDEIDDSVPIHAHSPWKGRIWRFTAQGDIIDPNMLIWYKFDEPNGFDAMDSSGYGNHGMLNGFENLWDTNDGHDGGCRIFDGETVVQVSSSVLSNIDRGISFSVWLKDNYTNSGNIVFGTGVGGETGPFRVQAEVLSGNDVKWRAGDDSNDLLLWNLSSQQGWHHFAFVKDEIADEMSIYFDGLLAASKTGVNDTLTNIRNAAFKVGAPTWSNYEYEGKMDDFKVWDRALTAQQVAGDFRGGDLGVAWSPNPGDNVVDVPRDKVLEWNAGDFAEFHDVYLGTSWDDVNDANTSTFTIYRVRRDVGDANYAHIEDFSLNTPYYWRIDEVNTTDGNSPWRGDVWRFTVANYIIIDDFEHYIKAPDNLWETWDNPHWSGSFVETGVDPHNPVNRGNQSMKYSYDITEYGWAFYAEVERNFDPPQDWTDADVKVLTLYFYGDPGNDANSSEQMSVGLEDGDSNSFIDYDGDMNDIKIAEWQEWNIVLSDFTGVDMNTSVSVILTQFQPVVRELFIWTTSGSICQSVFHLKVLPLILAVTV
ncbi:MAG: LamG domain-containing protein [Planctomycetota bacterium]